MLLQIPSELGTGSVTPMQHRKLVFKHNEKACNICTFISVKFDRVLYLVLRRKPFFFFVRLLISFLPKITHLIKWGFGCLYVLFDLLLLPLRKVSCMLNKKTKRSKKMDSIPCPWTSEEKKNQEYEIKSKDFHTSSNVAMDATNSWKISSVVWKIILVNSRGVRWAWTAVSQAFMSSWIMWIFNRCMSSFFFPASIWPQ